MVSAAIDIPPKTRRAFHGDLLEWFERVRRPFPWRKSRTAYRVWISELMLQQTRADQALPYYLRFQKKFPSLRKLAEAPLQDVLKLWEGLGYYARARNAHQAAQFIVRERNGRFPDTLDGLRSLPGVGPYTAAAVGSLAYGLDAAVVDGNVIRVVTRIFALADRKNVQGLVDRLLPSGRAGPFNEAMMELGAVVCLPRKPLCLLCPLNKVCRAVAEGNPEKYPVKSAATKIPHKEVGAGVIINDRREILLAQRPVNGMLGGLWEFPGGTRERGETMPQCIARELDEELGIRARVGPHILAVKHAFSHFTMNLHAYWVRVASGRPRAIQCDAVKWVPARRLREYPFPRADLKILDKVERTANWPSF